MSEELPKKEPDKYCNARRTDGSGYCGLTAGHGTDSDGGRCKFHGGHDKTGSNNPNYKHGLYSQHVDNDLLNRIEELERENVVDSLNRMLNMELARYEEAQQRYFELDAVPVLEDEKKLKSRLYDLLGKSADRISRIAQRIKEVDSGKDINIDKRIEQSVTVDDIRGAMSSEPVWKGEVTEEYDDDD